MNKFYEEPSIDFVCYNEQDIMLASGEIGDSQQDIFGTGGMK